MLHRCRLFVWFFQSAARSRRDGLLRRMHELCVARAALEGARARDFLFSFRSPASTQTGNVQAVVDSLPCGLGEHRVSSLVVEIFADSRRLCQAYAQVRLVVSRPGECSVLVGC